MPKLCALPVIPSTSHQPSWANMCIRWLWGSCRSALGTSCGPQSKAWQEKDRCSLVFDGPTGCTQSFSCSLFAHVRIFMERSRCFWNNLSSLYLMSSFSICRSWVTHSKSENSALIPTSLPNTFSSRTFFPQRPLLNKTGTCSIDPSGPCPLFNALDLLRAQHWVVVAQYFPVEKVDLGLPVWMNLGWASCEISKSR